MPESTATTSTDASQRRGPLRRAAAAAPRIGVGVALTAGLALAALMLVPAALGYERYVITGDSMDGAIDRGSLVYERTVPTSELRVGDVITYQPPPDTGLDGLVTHRIVSIAEGRQGEPVFRTQGDANEAPDAWRFTLDEPTQARAVFHVPYVGYAFGALSMRAVRIALIGVPALLIALALLARLWREAGEEARLLRVEPGSEEAA